MADENIKQVMQDAILDADSLEQFINGSDSETVLTRLSAEYPTLQKALKELFENGGIADRFKTLADLQASVLVDGDYALVADDTDDKNGVYIKENGEWVKSDYDPLVQAKAYADTNKLDYKQITYSYEGGNLIGAKSARYDDFGVSSTLVLTAMSTYKSVVIPVNEGDELFIHNDKNSFSGTIGAKFAFFALDPFLNQSQTAIPESTTRVSDGGVDYLETTVPVGANYLILNTKYGANEHTWAVHKDALNPSFESGEAFVSAINGVELPVGVTFDSLEASVFADGVVNTATQNAKVYADENKIDYADLGYSYTGDNKINAGTRLYEGFGLTGLYKAENNSLYDAYVLPVNGGDVLYVFNDTGSYSGSRGAGIGFFPSDPYVNQGQTRLDVPTTAITDPSSSISYRKITVPPDANFLVLNKEYRASAQTYEYVWAVQKDKFTASFDEGGALISSIGGVAIAGSSNQSEGGDTNPTKESRVIIKDFVDMNTVRSPNISTLKPLSKQLWSSGIAYTLEGEKTTDSTSNNLFTHVSINGSGKRKLGINVYNFNDDVKSVGKLKGRTFSVPSAILTEPNSVFNVENYPSSMIVHPSIAYSDTPVGGFKYWMIGSVYPPSNNGDAIWEDEEVYVSNDAKDWQRVRSMYETDKSYTTDTLRLPPQSLVTQNARKHGFLPCPSQGDVIEMSMPAHNGAEAKDREMVTLDGGFPWKHDPFIMIDGGYVYTYHTFHLPIVGREGTHNRFIVCVRTSDGVNWDVVRTDGSTMRLTEENSKTIFTKSADGKYNYMRYMYKTSGSNPEIIKYGEGDYELLYGANFMTRHKGSTPYNFDWETHYPVQYIGSSHHPGALLYQDNLYIVNQNGLFVSPDRGETLTQTNYFPLWVGGVAGFSYKRTMCIGEGGKLIVGDVQRQYAAESNLHPSKGFNKTNNINQLFLYEFASVDDFIATANNGDMDGYVDIQMCIVNFDGGNRRFKFYPAVSTESVPPSGGNVSQRLVIDELDLLDGDEIYFYVTLNSRRGGKILFGGIDLV